ncbi:MAG: phage portal protein [Phycisphaerales bacterium]|nr:phage portal protein [Phycisphaerales bacterium]
MPGLLERVLTIGRPFARRARVDAGVHPEGMSGWLAEWSGGGKVAGVPMDEWRMLNLSTVWCCISSISADVAKLPLHLYRRQEPAGRIRAKDHPAYPIWITQPNPEMTPLTAKQILVQHALRFGNGYGEIATDASGRRRQVWPLKSWKMRVVRLRNGELRYVYPLDAGGEEVFTPDQIFHLRGMGDGVVGMSVVRWAMRSMGVAAAAEEHAASTWENQAVPPIALRHPGKLSPAAAEVARKSWMDLYGGPDNAGKPAVLPEGMSVEKLSQSNLDAQFLESRKFGIAEICRWFRFPPHMAGDLDRATFSNIEHMSLQYVTMCLMYWLEAFEQECDRKLLLPEEAGDYYFEHTVDALLRGDAKTRAEATGQLLNNGVMTINEARDLYNLNPVSVEEGEVLRVPVNTMPLDRWREGAPDGESSPAPDDEPSPDPEAPPPAAEDDRDARFAAAIAVVFRGRIAEHLEAYQRLEADKARRAEAKRQLAEWSAGFYPEHRNHVHADMLAVAEHVRNAARVMTGNREFDIDCAAAAAEMASVHVGASLADLSRTDRTLAQVLASWDQARAGSQADAMFEILWKRVADAAKKEPSP